MIRRRKDYWFWYDRDTGEIVPMPQRTYRGSHAETPVTQSFLSRVITDPQPPRTVIPTRVALRRITACFAVPTDDGQSLREANLSIACPFRSGSQETLQQLREVKDFPGVLAMNYQGESFRRQ